jgi:hypothetical protein
MFFRFFFRRMSIQRQAEYVTKNGIMLGTRVKDGRKIFIYMIRSLFVEVTFRNDNLDDAAETIIILQGLDNLNDYLEKEFRASF